MRVHRSRPLLLIPLLLLPACAPVNQRPSPVAVVRLPAVTDPAARRAEIKRQLARVCPVPLDDARLERAAAFVLAHPEAAPIVGDLSALDAQARACRGL